MNAIVDDRGITFISRVVYVTRNAIQCTQATTLAEDISNYGANQGLCWLVDDAIWASEAPKPFLSSDDDV
jgi:hypothetical protein